MLHCAGFWCSEAKGGADPVCLGKLHDREDRNGNVVSHPVIWVLAAVVENELARHRGDTCGSLCARSCDHCRALCQVTALLTPALATAAGDRPGKSVWLCC